MTLPDMKNKCLDNTVMSIDRESLNMEIQESIKTDMNEKIKEEFQKGFNEIAIFPHTDPRSPKMPLSNPNVDYFDRISDSPDDEAIKEKIKKAIKQETEETTSEAAKKATKRKIDEVVDDGAITAELTDFNLATPAPSNIVNLPVDQTWNSFEEAYEAILDFIRCQGYGARPYQKFYRASNAHERVSRRARNLPNEYVHLECDLVETKKCDQVDKDMKRKHTKAKNISTCSFCVIVMKCLSCWRIVNILSARHSHEPLPPRALPSQHSLARKGKEAWVYQMTQKGFSQDQIVHQIQLQDPKSNLDRADVTYLRKSAKKKHESELQIQLQKVTTGDDLPNNGPLSLEVFVKKRRLERKLKKAYIIQQVQQGLSNEAIVRQILRQDPSSCLDLQDIATMRGCQKRQQTKTLQRQLFKGAKINDSTENHQLSEEESDADLAKDYKLLKEETSGEKDRKLPKKKISDERDFKLLKQEMDDDLEEYCKFPKNEKDDDFARV